MNANRGQGRRAKDRQRAVSISVSDRSFLWRDAGLYVLLVCSTLLAYWPAVQGTLVWDDNMHVTRPELQSLHGLWRIWFDLGATQQYYPLLHSAFWFEHRIWGDAALGYHLTNVLLHALSACLVVAIVRRLSLPGAWLAGFLFALHPVCVEAVAWISEQKSTLSGVFYLSSAVTYLAFDQSRRRTHYVWASAFFVLALLTKTVTATLPAVLLIVFWWRRGKIDWRREAVPLLPWFAIAVPAGLFTAWVERTPGLIGAQGAEYALTWVQRMLLAERIPWFYAWKAVWPWNLMFVYPHWTLSATDWRQYLFPLALAAVAALCVGLAFAPGSGSRRRAPLAVTAVFLLTLLPALGFFNVYPFRYSYVADHFQYLALLAILLPAAVGLTSAVARFPQAAPFLLAILPAIFAVADWRQSSNYQSYETLFRRTIQRNSASPFLHSNLGVILMSSGRETEAAAQFEEAVHLAPASAEYRVNLGLALAQLPGRIDDAIEEYRAALRIDPHNSSAHLNLGLAFTSMPGRLPDAIDEYQRAIAEYQKAAASEPDLWEAHFNLGMAYGQLSGRTADAIGELQTAIRMKPDSAMAHFHLGNVYHKSGRLPDAIAEYREAIGIAPDVPEVHYELAYALAQIPGKSSEAMVECKEMLRLKPGDKAGGELMAALAAFRQAHPD